MNNNFNINKTKYRLIYSFYLDNDSSSLNDHIAYKIHFKCLEYILYTKNIANTLFDEIYFIIHTLDLNNHLIEYVKQKLSKITINCNNVHFIIEKNIPEYREGIIFKKYILDKLDEYDGLTLFFHNKGYHKRYNNEFPSYWIISQYFFNMFIEDYKEYFKTFLNNKNKLLFGFPIDKKNPDGDAVSDNLFFYAGSCYWMKCQDIFKYINDNNIKLEYSCFDIFWLSEFCFPVILNLLTQDLVDYPFSSIIKLDKIIYTNNFNNTSTFFNYINLMPYIIVYNFLDFYDYIMNDIENYKI